MISPKGKYEYDSLYRLKKATGREKDSLPMPGSGGYTPDFVATDAQSSQTLRTYCQQFTYDELGNIQQLSHRATCGGSEHWKRNYQYNTNTPNNYLLSTYTGSTPPGTPEYTYDNHGNMLEMPHLSALNWDFADQLKSSEKTDETTHYVYSGGERVRKVVMDTSGATDRIKYERIYLGGYELYREYDSSENLDLERETHHVMDSLSASGANQRKIALLEVKTLNNGTTIANGSRTTIARYQYTNHLDSACLELNDSAEILSYEEYHPFGTTSYSLHTNDSEVSLKRYKYVHKERDDESGLYYYGARYYAPWLCRFVSVDPLKDKYPFYATYQYAGNKPVTFIDLDGLEEAESNISRRDATRVKQFPKLSFPKPYSSFHTSSGKLTETVKRFLSPALKLDREGLDDTKWTAYSEFDGNFWQDIAANTALEDEEFGAITLNKDVVFLDQYKHGGKNAEDWLSLIAHEQIHIQQYRDRGLVGFGVTYGLQMLEYGYKMDPTEDLAYRIEDAMEEWLRDNPDVVDQLTKDWQSMSQSEKEKIVELGKLFRLEAGIDAEIQFWSNWATELRTKIDELKSGIPEGATTPEIEQLELLYSSYRDVITDLHLERSNLNNELNGN